MSTDVPYKKKGLTKSCILTCQPAVVGLTKSDGIHYSPHGIRINAVCPGYVETPLISGTPESERIIAFLLDNSPVKRLVSPDEVADGMVFLASPLSSAMYASTLSLDLGISNST